MPILLGSGTVARQYANEGTPFDVTLAVADTAEDLVTPPTGKVIRRVNIVNEGPGTAHISFDGTATTTDLALAKGDSYSEADVEIVTNISFIGGTSKTPRVRGLIWSN